MRSIITRTSRDWCSILQSRLVSHDTVRPCHYRLRSMSIRVYSFIASSGAPFRSAIAVLRDQLEIHLSPARPWPGCAVMRRSLWWIPRLQSNTTPPSWADPVGDPISFLLHPPIIFRLSIPASPASPLLPFVPPPSRLCFPNQSLILHPAKRHMNSP